jgi:hypothetical protein
MTVRRKHFMVILLASGGPAGLLDDDLIDVLADAMLLDGRGHRDRFARPLRWQDR